MAVGRRIERDQLEQNGRLGPVLDGTDARQVDVDVEGVLQLRRERESWRFVFLKIK